LLEIEHLPKWRRAWDFVDKRGEFFFLLLLKQRDMLSVWSARCVLHEEADHLHHEIVHHPQRALLHVNQPKLLQLSSKLHVESFVQLILAAAVLAWICERV